MKTILLPIDFSPASEKSISFAIEMGKTMCAKIILFNTTPVLDYTPELPLIDTQEFYDKEENTSKSKMEKICSYIKSQKDNSGQNLKSESIHSFNAVTTDIALLCKEKDIDLVVIGTNGKENLFGFFESTTLDVMNYITCPILIVQKDLIFRPFKNIVFALEKLDRDILNTSLLLSLVKKFDPYITILQTASKESEYLRDNDTSEAEFIFLKAVKESTNFSKIRIHKMFIEDPTKALIQNLEDKEVDLLVLQKQDRFWLKELFHKSFTKNILKKTNIPVLVLPHLQ